MLFKKDYEIIIKRRHIQINMEKLLQWFLLKTTVNQYLRTNN